MLFAQGSPEHRFTDTDLEAGLYEALEKAGGKTNRVLAIPPDFTRFHSRAGRICELLFKYYGKGLVDVLPALGTHAPLGNEEIERMFGALPFSLFRVHDWRNDIVTLGSVPASFVEEVSEGKLHFPWPVQVNRLLVSGRHDLIFSIGQVVPHEVVGMANHSKNIFVGTGGKEGIDKSHFLGAVYGMERLMGRSDTPVRALFRYASAHFASGLPILYILTVVGRDGDGGLALRGLFIGDDEECFYRAAELSRKVNISILEEPLDKVVVYLDPNEFKSFWLGNKAIYRTRMALRNSGELVILAPGVKQFGEDPGIDTLIRKYGYCGTDTVLDLVEKNCDLRESLSAAAHLIHGSSEGRFSITYCPGGLSREETERAGFAYADPHLMLKTYDPAVLKDGFNTLRTGERVFFISNPALGLWASKERFGEADIFSRDLE